MLTCYSYARLKVSSSGKEPPHKSDGIGALARRRAAASAGVFSLRLEGFEVGSRHGQASRIASGGRSMHFTKLSACGKAQLAPNTPDPAGRVKTLTPGARAN